ncbi:hypothetical protein BX589_115201 [Paraburkholderia fungorum]|jgi:phenylacetate-CoA ligase|nr:hypothetical protein BX589_115201 [Paraburkholderia fungorum]
MVQRTPRAYELEPIERVSRDQLEAVQLQRLKWSLHHAYKNVSHYRKSFDATGVHPEDLKEISDLSKFRKRSIDHAPQRLGAAGSAHGMSAA